MFDLDKLSDEDKKLLQEIAKAKGKSLEEMLVELGHAKKPEVVESSPETDEPVVFSATKTEEAVTPPAVTATTAEPELPPAAAEEPEPEIKQEEDESAQGMATARSVCSHCGWDQAIPPIPEPERQDKIIFLQAILGQKVFTKQFLLFGGNLRVTFRSLTVREIDALYVETFKAQKAGVIDNTTDYYEFLNRQRLYLQLTHISSNQFALHITLPDGYTEETHPNAGTYWDNFLKSEKQEEPNTSLMLRIQDYILSNVLKTEHLQRTINHACGRFNRMVAKLEANVDNENFWKETEPPS
jgi:hypothetical protein